MDRREFVKRTGAATLAWGLVGGRAVTAGSARAGDSGPAPEVLDLRGDWGFHLDPENVGREFESWFGVRFSDQIRLPGSTDEAGYGTKTTGPEFGHLSRAWRYEGLSWVQRDVFVPDAWAGKRIVLFLERPHWVTTVWVDDREMDTHDSLSAPHVHDLSEALTPGLHRISIRIDNRVRLDVGRNAHSVTDHTQTNWHGIVGRIELQAADPVWIDGMRIFPDVGRRRFRVEGTVRNRSVAPVDGEVYLAVRRADAASRWIRTTTARLPRTVDESRFESVVELSGDFAAWDPLDPALYVLEATLVAGNGRYSSRRVETFGMREIAADGRRILLNGRPIFLRGTLECCIFPETGYPPTDVASWARLFAVARTHGLNHFRFHSWCPPEAAFAAADRAGFLLHVETPVWAFRVGRTPDLDAFMRAEAERMQDTYGNHPSFAMMALGNELDGDWSYIDATVAALRRRDPRRLYTSHADHTRFRPEPSAQYYVCQRTSRSNYLRLHGSDRIRRPMGTDFDFSGFLDGIGVPTLAHELGQWVVNPAYEDLARYDGPLEPRSLAFYRDQLEARGMGDQAEAMQRATGRFAWLLYKEDMETCLRTPGFGGFQLLQLQDFPGQGEALVGLLSAFWEEKGFVTPAEFRQCCSDTVPLMRTERFVWTSAETFRAGVWVHHFGRDPMPRAVVGWRIERTSGEVYAEGSLGPADIGIGVTEIGAIEVPLDAVSEAACLNVRLTVADQGATNGWKIWVFPDEPPVAPEGVFVASRYDAEVRRRLYAGERVLVLSPPEAPAEGTLPARFLPVFWSLSWFPEQPGTSSILCDPAHPALEGFPTEFHSDWQWQELLNPSKAFVLDDTPHAYRPLVQLVDDFHRNHKLGLLIETRVGSGRLLACGLNLDTAGARPVARRLLQGLYAYMASDAFAPTARLDEPQLERWLG